VSVCVCVCMCVFCLPGWMRMKGGHPGELGEKNSTNLPALSCRLCFINGKLCLSVVRAAHTHTHTHTHTRTHAHKYISNIMPCGSLLRVPSRKALIWYFSTCFYFSVICSHILNYFVFSLYSLFIYYICCSVL
jgi:hypothetical protein